MVTSPPNKPIKKQINRVKKYIIFARIFPAIYKKAARQPVDGKKVLFVETISPELTDNFRFLYERLEGSGFERKIILLKRTHVSKVQHLKNCFAFVKEMATAKYVLFNDACGIPGRIKLREETKLYNVWHACGAFKRFGMGTAKKYFGADTWTHLRYPYYSYLDGVFVSSPEVVWAYSESMLLPKEKVLPLGISRTDIFFDREFTCSAREKLYELMPSARGKKVILYAPTFRGTVTEAEAPDALSVPAFFESLSDEYVLVIKHHPYAKKRPEIGKEYAEFARDFTGKISIEELLPVADVLISDYSSVVFEYSLFGKPMIFFAYDLENYNDWRGFYYDYSEMTPGPIFSKNEEITEYIRHIKERFDPEIVDAFRQKFMSACDGHATERIAQEIFGK